MAAVSALQQLGDYGSDSSDSEDIHEVLQRNEVEFPSDGDGEATDSRPTRASGSSPTAKKRLAFPPSGDTPPLNILTHAASSVSDDETVDVIPLANLRSRARARWASKRPLESDIDSSLVLDSVSSPLADPAASVAASTLAQVATKCFTRSQAAKFLAESCPPKKRKLDEILPEPSQIPAPDDDSGIISDSLPPFESDVVCPGPLFFRSELHMNLWDCVTGRTFLREHSLHPDKANHACIVSLLREIGLIKSVLTVPSFVIQVVIEFYCNLSSEVRKS